MSNKIMPGYIENFAQEGYGQGLKLFTPGGLKDFNAEGNIVTLNIEAECFRVEGAPNVNDAFAMVYKRDCEKRNIAVKLTVCKEGIIRVTAGLGSYVELKCTEMVTDDFKDPVCFTVEDMEHTVVITTQKIVIAIGKNPWCFNIKNPDGNEVFSQQINDVHIWNWEIEGFTFEDRYFNRYPFGFLVNTADGKVSAVENIVMKHDEHIFGLGEKFSSLDKKGRKFDVWHMDAMGTATERSYKNIPFYMSSRGYGLFLNSSYRSRFGFGDYSSKSCTIEVDHCLMDYYLIIGPSFKNILDGYTEVTGKSPMLPKWSFGLWMSKMSYKSREEIEELASKLRGLDFPCDVIHLDTSWFKKDWICEWKFSEERFPDPEGMVREFLKKGFRISLWQLPYVHKEAYCYEEGNDKRYYAKKQEEVLGSAVALGDGVIDFSNEEAAAWYKDKLRPLLEMGIGALKTDFGESAPDNARYCKYPGEEMHNLYPLLYNRAAYEVTKEITGEGIIWGRCAFAGSQRHPLYWGGDSISDFDNLAGSIRAGLSMGLSGFPFWSHDIGGFAGRPVPELYIRWFQAGMFTSHARCHGATPREPWNFGEQALDITRKFAKVRYALMPYIYSEAFKCTRTGLPMMRALVLEFQDDPAVYQIDDQYMFGDSILVAPVLSEGGTRKVYLPEGEWYDYWTKEKYSGRQWVELAVPLHTMPLFVKGGSIILMCEDMSHTMEKEWHSLKLEIYGEPLEYVLYDGVREDRISTIVEDNRLVIFSDSDRKYAAVHFR